MSDLTEFLLARLAEDEAVARSMPFEPHWTSHPEETGQPIRAGSSRIATCAESVMAHIARHDPARVLADVEAKRRIVGLWRSWDENTEESPPYWSAPMDEVLTALAAVYADHEDYDEGWKP